MALCGSHKCALASLHSRTRFVANRSLCQRELCKHVDLHTSRYRWCLLHVQVVEGIFDYRGCGEGEHANATGV